MQLKASTVVFDHSIEQLPGNLIKRTAKESGRMEVEVALLQRLNLKVATPKPTFEPPATMIYPKLLGQHVVKDFPNLASELAHSLFELHHALTVDEARALGLTDFDWPLLPEALAKGVPPLLSLPAAKRLFERFIQDYVVAEPTVLVHNDIHSSNLLAENERLVAIIDFSEAAIGEPYLDFRYLPFISRDLFEESLSIYSSLGGQRLDLKRATLYYFATEFSRLLERGGSQEIEERLLAWQL